MEEMTEFTQVYSEEGRAPMQSKQPKPHKDEVCISPETIGEVLQSARKAIRSSPDYLAVLVEEVRAARVHVEKARRRKRLTWRFMQLVKRLRKCQTLRALIETLLVAGKKLGLGRIRFHHHHQDAKGINKLVSVECAGHDQSED